MIALRQEEKEVAGVLPKSFCVFDLESGPCSILAVTEREKRDSIERGAYQYSAASASKELDSLACG